MSCPGLWPHIRQAHTYPAYHAPCHAGPQQTSRAGAAVDADDGADELGVRWRTMGEQEHKESVQQGLGYAQVGSGWGGGVLVRAHDGGRSPQKELACAGLGIKGWTDDGWA